MTAALTHIAIPLNEISEGLRLLIDARSEGTLFDAGDAAADNNEARFQLAEGCFYDYELTDSCFYLGDIGENIILPHKRNPYLGSIAPNIFTGTLRIPVVNKKTGIDAGFVELEVQSVKTGYRQDYRDMLEFITEQCTALLMQSNSPSSHYFESDYSNNSRTLYQRFAFVQSVIGSVEFAEAVHRIVTSPVTRWIEITEQKDIRGIRRFGNSHVKQFLKDGAKTTAPDLLRSRYGLTSLPERITASRKTDSADTPENRFVKHALETFLKFCTDINAVAGANTKLGKESLLLLRQLESYLHHSIFREISRPATLKLNSPVLQRKEGYRELLRVWLMFDLAAKLIWRGGDDIYAGSKKDIATLYEYWLFFKLLELFGSVFDISPKSTEELIEPTAYGLNLQLKQGRFTALEGTYDAGSRKLNIRFCYNRSFNGSKNYPASGSWTTTLRPDYTLSFWPFGIDEAAAEQEELIVHVHFDAKYKVANLYEQISRHSDKELDEEKKENRKGRYKNADLLKMHAYKDAIRRTGGAYVLYPGDESVNRKGFHEIIPGLGAFPVRPSKTDNGTADLKAFILEIIAHFVNRTSQREKLAYRTFAIYKNPPQAANELRETMPEPYGANRDLIPDETFVLVGYFNSDQQYRWIEKNKLYNFRTGTGNGSLILDNETVSAKYLLLHGAGDEYSSRLWKVKGKGPKVWSREDLEKRGYPKKPSQPHYLILELEAVTDEAFLGLQWQFKKLANYQAGRASAFPYTASLRELMQVKVVN